MDQIQKRVIQSTDDGYVAGTNQWISSWTTLTLGRSSTGFEYKGAFRFQNINIVDATIDTATLTIRYDGSISQSGIDGPIHTGPISVRIYGIAEDNTDTFIGDTLSSEEFANNPTTRELTEAFVDWNIPISVGNQQTFTSPDISSIIQEIIDRAGWEGNNAIGLVIVDNGSANKSASFMTYDNVVAHRPLLTINYEGTTLTSKLITARSRLYNPRQYGVKIIKPGFSQKTTDPSEIIFDSDFGTLKYFASGTVLVENSEGCAGTYQVFNHNLGYFPYVEVFVKIPAVNNNFVYCPAAQLGAKFEFFYTYEVTTTQIRFLISNGGEFADEATFKYFIFRNDLGL